MMATPACASGMSSWVYPTIKRKLRVSALPIDPWAGSIINRNNPDKYQNARFNDGGSLEQRMRAWVAFAVRYINISGWCDRLVRSFHPFSEFCVFAM